MGSQSLTGQTDASILASLEAAARRVHASIRGIGQHASYPYPDDAGGYSGFSYTIPKEEQIRSEFYRYLDKARGARFELEWNVYDRRRVGKRERIVRSGEIDLVGFQNKDVVAALEVKRTWNLKGWYAKSLEHVRSIESDVNKLRSVLAKIRRRESNRPVAGVIVARFADSAERMRELGLTLRSRFADVICLHADDAHVCEEQPNRKVRLHMDFVVVE